MAIQFDELSRSFLSLRLGKVLTEKDKANAKYHKANKVEANSFRALAKTLTMGQMELFDAYQTALLDRQVDEVYFTYLCGLRDGINIYNILEGEQDKTDADNKKQS